MASTPTSKFAGWAMLLPVLVLVLVALNQARLHASDHLSSWRGGGFGMFATVDRDYLRSFHATITLNTGDVVDVKWESVSRYLKADASRSDALADALALPSEHNLRHIVTLLAGVHWQINGNEATAVSGNTGNKFDSSTFHLSLYGPTYSSDNNQVIPVVISEWRGNQS